MLFSQCLCLDGRFADDKCRLWIFLPSTDTTQHKTYQDYCDFLNRLFKLDQECSPLSKEKIFMDLEAWMNKPTKKAKQKSYTKPENLYLVSQQAQHTLKMRKEA